MQSWEDAFRAQGERLAKGVPVEKQLKSLKKAPGLCRRSDRPWMAPVRCAGECELGPAQSGLSIY